MSQPGNNDDVIRYVYQAVADFSQLLRETRRAREETSALKRDIEGLAGSTEHRVKVTADTGQARTELARVFRDIIVQVKVTVDAVAAKAELSRLLRDTRINVAVSADTAAARDEIRRATAGGTANVNVALDRGGVIGKMRALIAYLQNMGPVRLAVELDRRGITEATRKAVDDVKRMREELRAPNPPPDDIPGPGPGTPRPGPAGPADGRARQKADEAYAAFHQKIADTLGGVDRKYAGEEARIAHETAETKKKIDDAYNRSRIAGHEAVEKAFKNTPDDGGGGGGGGKGAGGIVPEGIKSAAGFVAGWGSLIAAAVPVAAALAVGVGAVASAFAAAGAATGIFAVAAIGAFSKAKDAVEAYEKTGTLAKDGNLRDVVSGVENLKARYGELEKATEKPIFRVFNQGLDIAVRLLDKVQPLIASATAGVSDAVGEIGAAIDGADFDRFLAFVGREGPSAIVGFTRGLLGFGAGLGNLLVAFEPFIHDLVGGFADAGAAFDRWAAGLGQNTAFQRFLAYAKANLPAVIAFIGNLVAAAGNLIAGLAPIGSVLLKLVSGALSFIAALPPSALTAIIGLILSFAIALKAVQAAMAVASFVRAFTEALPGLAARLGVTATAAGAARLALIGLGTALGIGLLLTGIAIGLQALSAASDRAAEAAQRHKDRVVELSDALRANKGEVTADTRAQSYQNLDRDKIELGTFQKGNYNTNLFSHVDTKTLAGYLGEAGIGAGTVADAGLGDAAAIAQSRAALKKLQGDYNAKQLHAKVEGDPAAADNFEAQANAIGNAITQLDSYNGVMGDAVDRNKKLAEVEAGTASAIKATADAAAAAAKTPAGADAEVKKRLATVDFASDPDTQKANAAVAAMDAYNQALQDKKDAELAATRADEDAKNAQLDLNEARKAAVQHLIELRRQLRDMPLDERQAQLNVRQSDKRLQDLIAKGATPDEIEQARLDDERAHNAANDLNQDKAGKRKSITDELARGVGGNRQLQAAERTNEDAQRNLTTANTNLVTSARKLSDLHTVFAAAAGSLGLTQGQVKTLAANIAAIKDKEINITANTKSARQQLAAILQGQYAIQLQAQHPDWSPDKVWAEAGKLVPHAVGGPAPAADPNRQTSTHRRMGGPYDPGYAAGGPTVGPTAGAVHGPGTGTSDSVFTVLPVGGPSRLSRGEHIVTDAEVQAAPGGHAYMEAFRAALRAGRRWAPVASLPPAGYAGGGRAVSPVPANWSVAFPAWRVPGVPAAVGVPGYAAGGAVAARGDGAVAVDRSVTINGGIHVSNAVPEPAGPSLYRVVRRAVEGDDL